MTPAVTVWDVPGVADELVTTLGTYRADHVIAHPLYEIAAHVDHSAPDVLHLITGDDGFDLPVNLGTEPLTLPPLWTTHTPGVVILDGCYEPAAAERLRVAGSVVIGLPGRLGRGNADDFLRNWYARYPAAPAAQAFDDAMNSTALHNLPDVVQPRLHHAELKGPVEFRNTDGTPKRTVTVWYGTNRRPDPDPKKLYGAQPDDELHTGRCDVIVPAGVPVGRTRTRRTWGRRPTSYTICDHHQLGHDAFHHDLRAALEQTEIGERTLLVYIHGYRTTFTEAATRAAQLHVDLNHPGHTAFFSWPSRGTAQGYFSDEDAVQHAERHLLQFLTDLCQQTDAERVDLIAHSMGNRALLRVAMRLANATPSPIRFGHILLAAADVGRLFFRAEATVYHTVADKVTSYVCDRDKALRSSGILHAGDRAGLTPPYTHIDGVDTIDASDVDLTLLGHGYYAAARPVLVDMHLLLRGAHDPERRHGLARISDPGQTVWRIRG